MYFFFFQKNYYTQHIKKIINIICTIFGHNIKLEKKNFLQKQRKKKYLYTLIHHLRIYYNINMLFCYTKKIREKKKMEISSFARIIIIGQNYEIKKYTQITKRNY